MRMAGGKTTKSNGKLISGAGGLYTWLEGARQIEQEKKKQNGWKCLVCSRLHALLAPFSISEAWLIYVGISLLCPRVASVIVSSLFEALLNAPRSVTTRVGTYRPGAYAAGEARTHAFYLSSIRLLNQRENNYLRECACGIGLPCMVAVE